MQNRMSDEEILAMYRAGDRERAFNELVGSFSERLYWHVRGLTGSHDDTDDLLQDIFIKIWRSLPDFRGDAQLYTWIFRIATNETLNFLRKRNLRTALGLQARTDTTAGGRNGGRNGTGRNGSRTTNQGSGTAANDGLPPEAERIPDPDPYFNGDEAQRLLAMAVRQLPPRQRAVFHMRYFEEMPYDQMAGILGVSVSALKASYHFAYEKIKDYLLKNYEPGI